MCALAPEERVALLVRRVCWLDRYRRIIAVCAALVMAPLSMHQLATLLGTQWPQVHVTLLDGLVAIMTWWFVEVALAWLAALWETEYDRRTRERRAAAVRHPHERPRDAVSHHH